MPTYQILNGAKVEYSPTKSGTYTQIMGVKTMPDFGSTPNKVDTTTLDNTKYETNINGLIPAVDLTYELNLEEAQASANIYKVYTLATSDTAYWWKVTFPSGVVIQYESKVAYAIKGGSSEDLETFEMYHAPMGEMEITVPSATA